MTNFRRTSKKYSHSSPASAHCRCGTSSIHTTMVITVAVTQVFSKWPKSLPQECPDNMLRGNQEGLPRLVYTDSTAIYLGGVEVQAFHLGTGHTNGIQWCIFRSQNHPWR